MPSASRRAVLTAALGIAVVTACEDTAGPGLSPSTPRTPASPTQDAAVLAALHTAAGQIRQTAAHYPAVVRRHPALRPRLAPAIQHRSAQLARLKALGGTPTAPPGKPRPVPAKPEAALAELAARESALSVAHATAAGRLSGEPARLLAAIAAGEAQLAVALGRR